MKCYIHNFQTFDVEEWDRHCYYTGHTNIVYQKSPDGNIEKVEEPYARHHMRDAIARGEIALTMFDPDELK